MFSVNNTPYAILIGSAPLGAEARLLKEYAAQTTFTEDVSTKQRTLPVCIYAADGGIRHCLTHGIRPTVWFGDMDSTAPENTVESIGKAFPGLSIETCSPIKDETDMDLGVRMLRTRHPEVQTVLIFGGAGGERLDHMLANFQLMHRYASEGLQIILFSAKDTYIALHNSSVTLKARPEGTLSVFSLTDIAKEVAIEGAFYEFHGELTNTFALGVSNHFVGKPVTVSVGCGTLLISAEYAILLDKQTQSI